MTYVFYNPEAGNGCGREKAEALGKRLGEKITYLNIKEYRAKDIAAFAPDWEKVVIAGGDGTLNRFINELNGEEPEREIYYYPAGSGNDFMSDVKEREGEDGLVLLNPYLRRLPAVTVKGEERKFLNGIGYGIDGYCCEKGDALRAAGKKANYTAIAIKGLLFHFRPRNAFITVDGEEHSFEKVWLAPVMNGRFYGGGMMVAPEQDRLNEGGKLTLIVMHCASRLRTLAVFPSIFKGEHVKHTDMVAVLKGREIRIAFDRPTALQIDGETVKGVTAYTARSANAGRQRENAEEMDEKYAAV